MTSKAVVAVVAEHDLDLEVLALGALEGGGAETGGHAVIFRDTTVSWLSNYMVYVFWIQLKDVIKNSVFLYSVLKQDCSRYFKVFLLLHFRFDANRVGNLFIPNPHTF